MNICIIGGGNIGTTLAADLANLHSDYSIRLLTSRPNEFNQIIQINDVENNQTIFGEINLISSDVSKTVAESDIIFITHPSFLIDKTLEIVAPYVKNGAYIGVIPGFGGCEFYAKDRFDKSVTLFGFQRVPYIVRMQEYGKVSNLTSRKSQLIIGAIPPSKTDAVCGLMENLLHVSCISVPSYLSVTLTPSNPILHTARVYDLFHEASPDTIYPENPKFYEEWTLRASETLLAMDAELQELCRSIEDLDLSSVISLKIHYESETPEALTEKMRSIISLKDMTSPMRPAEGGFKPDLQSRYFIEDFPFGLCIIKGFCEIYQLKTPMIDTVLKWYEKLSGVEYFTNGRFEGRDLKNTAIPQNFGIMMPDDVISFYGKPEGICPPPLLINTTNSIFSRNIPEAAA